MIKKWIGYRFETSTVRTPEYISFERDLRADLRKQLKKNGLELANFDGSHFEFSAFIRNPETDKYVYIRISDVRFFPDEWFKHTLIRTAANEKDYRGGANGYAPWNDVGKASLELTRAK